MPLWTESVLKLPQTRAELKRILEDEGVLDMDFEEEVVKDIERWYGGEVHYKANEESLSDDIWTLKRFGSWRPIMRMASCPATSPRGRS